MIHLVWTGEDGQPKTILYGDSIGRLAIAICNGSYPNLFSARQLRDGAVDLVDVLDDVKERVALTRELRSEDAMLARRADQSARQAAIIDRRTQSMLAEG